MGMAVLARLPDSSGRDIQRLLDSGIEGLVIPQVHDTLDAGTALDLTMFPSHGGTGFWR